MMQRTIRFALAAMLCAAMLLPTAPAIKAAGGEHAYIADLEDLPLMDGLDEVPEAGVSFDKPVGRIVEAFAHGAVDRQAVRAFYRRTLPQLGWSRADADRFMREGELLEIDYLGADGDLTVRYTLQPR